MIGLDTNVLVRYLAQDDAVQSARATRIIERHLTEDRPAFISLVTLVETVWVLDRLYGQSDGEIAAAIERILQVGVFVVQNEQEAFTAMVALKTGAGTFSDALIGALGACAGCTATLTFDKGTKRLKQFRLL
ncbi:MAG: type II toxin-antitoxin system VapC family toxin [Acidobacteriaceae bacterium]|nr:type II toxin-antitoxin system VapC family toxin [Acidobacteriaceae bacterium]